MKNMNVSKRVRKEHIKSVLKYIYDNANILHTNHSLQKLFKLNAYQICYIMIYLTQNKFVYTQTLYHKKYYWVGQKSEIQQLYK